MKHELFLKLTGTANEMQPGTYHSTGGHHPPCNCHSSHGLAVFLVVENGFFLSHGAASFDFHFAEVPPND